MERPNLTPAQNQDKDPAELSFAEVITNRYQDFPYEDTLPFLVNKGAEYTPMSLEEAIRISSHYEGKGVSREDLLAMLDAWHSNAKITAEAKKTNPHMKAQLDALSETVEDGKVVKREEKVARYILSLEE